VLIIAGLIFLVGLAFAGFLWWLAARSFALLGQPGTTPEHLAALRDMPMALPEGTVRAILALIVGVVGLPLLLFAAALNLSDAVAGYVNGIIAGVFGYYFGARATTPDAQRDCMRQEREAMQTQRKQFGTAMRELFQRNGIPVPDWSKRQGGRFAPPSAGSYGWDHPVQPGQPGQPLPLPVR
jgi:hypothetical protein